MLVKLRAGLPNFRSVRKLAILVISLLIPMGKPQGTTPEKSHVIHLPQGKSSKHVPSKGFLNPSIQVLDNGLTVVVLQDQRAPVVDVYVAYKVGGADDPEKQVGIAHYLEHVMFKGIPGLAENEFFDSIHQWGGSVNASTYLDYTVYESKIPKQHLPKVLEWEGRRMQSLDLSDKAVETERPVILAERSQRMEGHYQSIVIQELFRQLFTNHPYRRPNIGWDETIKNTHKEHLLAFHQQFYRPSNAFLVLAGDITPGEALQLAKQYFGHIPSLPPVTRVRPDEPKAAPGISTRVQLQDERIHMPFLVKARTVSSYRPETAVLCRTRDVLTYVLTGLKSSFLYQKLVEEKKIALSVGVSHNDVMRDHGTFDIALTPRQGVSLEAAEQALDEAIQGFLKKGISQAEVTKAVQRLLIDRVFMKDDTSTCGGHLADLLSGETHINQLEKAEEEYAQVTAEMVMKEAHALLQSMPVTLFALPKGKESPDQKKLTK